MCCGESVVQIGISNGPSVAVQAISAIMAFDRKLIPLFDGTDAGQSVVEWVEKAELVCRLSGVKNI